MKHNERLQNFCNENEKFLKLEHYFNLKKTKYLLKN